MFRVIKRILSYTGREGRILAACLIFAAAGTAASLFIPVLIGKGVDAAASAGHVDFSALKEIVLILGVLVAVSGFFQWLTAVSTNHLAAKTVCRIRTELLAKLQVLPLRYIDNSARGDLINRAVSDLEIISDGFVAAFTQFITGICTILGTIVFMLTIHIPCTIIVVLLTPLSLLLAGVLTRLSRSAYLEAGAARGRLSGLAEEYLQAHALLRSFDYTRQAEANFREANLAQQKSGQRSTFIGSITNPATRFVNALIYAAVAVVGGLAVTGHFRILGVMTVGQLVSFLTFANQYTKPFNEISGVAADLQNAIACAVRVFELLDEEPETDAAAAVRLDDPDGTVRFDDVSFSYLPSRPLIRHFSLRADAGRRIAIVGPTGCGKTTLMNLLLRFYDVNEGAVCVSGMDIRHITRDSLRRSFGMVLQETWLFSGTIAQNIAFSRPDATQAQIEAAARSAYADSFIRQLPDGYQTVITGDGGGLSQGQKQLLCIARIMLTDPAILLLDEATSSIDLRTEQRIQQAFEKLMQGRTTFVIAHRLSTIRHADCILVMNHGNVVEQGKHEELLAAGGFYAELYNSQLDTEEGGD